MITKSYSSKENINNINGLGSGKTTSLFNLMSHHQILIKIYLYAKDPYKGKYQSRIHKGEDKGLNHLNDSKA